MNYDKKMRMRATNPRKQHQEVLRSAKALYQSAIEVEKDSALNKEMLEWDLTLRDGLDEEP